jgi:hypothetical protein
MWDRLPIRQTGWLPVPQSAGAISLVPQRVDEIEPRIRVLVPSDYSPTC